MNKTEDMNFPWFRRSGALYIPISLMGYLLLSGGLFYSVFVFLAIDSKSHSASDTLMNFVFYLLIIAAGYTLVGYLTSRPSGR